MIHFLLTPDKSSALALKRRVAERNGRRDVIVGTWRELLTQAGSCHVLPMRHDRWQEKLTEAVKGMESAFWAASLRNVPAEEDAIVAIVEKHLVMLLEGLGPDRALAALAGVRLPERLGRRIGDFITLHKRMGGTLPPDLAVITGILASGPERRLRPMRVYHLADWPQLNPWQQALIGHLNAAAGAEESSLRLLLDGVPGRPAAPAPPSLRFLQENLFSLPSVRIGRDSSLQWLSVRDYLEEIEICTGMVQAAVQEVPGSPAFADLALLLPDDELYAASARAVFASAGIPLADPCAGAAVRDLGADAVLQLLLTLKKPSPVMAAASLLTSPLMPWESDTGNILAQRVIGGDFRLDEFREVDSRHVEMLGTFRHGAASARQLKLILDRFPGWMRRGKPLEAHVASARQLCAELSGMLVAGGDIPWDRLIARVPATPLKGDGKEVVSRYGVAVFREGHEPWRQVRRLYVLGCSEGRYPAAPAASRVFTEGDLLLLRAAGVAVDSMAGRTEQQRELFRRQLGSASEQVTFFVPRRDPLGATLAPSASLTFAAALFNDVADEESLCCELETAEGRTGMHSVPVRIAPPPDEPAPPPTAVHLGRNLLLDNAGSPRVESPSRLETLMVSPLAWLLDRFGIAAREWEPEKLDIMAKGILAHDVFEHLFREGKELPSAAQIEAGVGALLTDAVRRKMIFLMADEWNVERAHLEKEILKAALGWGEILWKIGAAVVATEVPLQGTFAEIPIHGNADLLLELPGDRLLVVDYKKSGSRGRRTRMQEGYDHQAELYRKMLETGGLEVKKGYEPPAGLEGKLALFRNAGEIGTLYYLMNDRTALADTRGWLPRDAAGTEEVSASTSVQAMKLLRERLRELSGGFIDLQLKEKESDMKGKRGLGVYALDNSPLVRMFLIEPDEQSERC